LENNFKEQNAQLAATIEAQIKHRTKWGLESDTNVISERHMVDTKEAVKRNRKRLMGAVAVSAVFGVAGAEVASHVVGSGHLFGSGPHHTPNHGSTGTHPHSIPSNKPGSTPPTHNPGTTPPENHPHPIPSAGHKPEVNSPSEYGGYQWPWDYYHKYFGAEATAKIDSLIEKARAAGWHVNEFNRGSTDWGIASMQGPNGSNLIYSTPDIIATLNSFEG